MDSSWLDAPGIALGGADIAARAPRLARAADHAGLGSVWVLEDYFFPGAFTIAGAVAAATERLTVGIGVVNPYTRHPALIAMETAALLGLAHGRVVLGLGSSNRRWIEGQMAIPFSTPLQALAEAVEIVRRLVDGERLTYRGRCFTLDDVALSDVPEHPLPILLGVKGPKALGLAGAIADGVHATVLSTPAHVRRIRRTATPRDGRRLVVVAYVPVVVARDARTAREQARPLLAHYLGVLHGQSVLADAGLDEATTAPFRNALVTGAHAEHLVTDDLVDRLAVAGTPDDCRRALARWAEAGLDAPIAIVPPGTDLEEQIRLIGAELAPCWKEIRCR